MFFSVIVFYLNHKLSRLNLLYSSERRLPITEYAIVCERPSSRFSMSSYLRQIFSKIFNNTERRRRRRSMSLGNDWSYSGENGPENWHKNFPVASSEYQSPINIDTYNVIYDPALGDINFLGYHSCSKKQFFRLKNTGYAVKIDLRGEIRIQNFENNCFEAFTVQFHWGRENSTGSEHQINHKSFPMEIQILHRNVKYTDEEEMLYKLDGMTTLGIFAEVGDEENEGFKYITDQFKYIKYQGQEIEIPAFPLSLLLPLDSSKYYTYSGSLTAPPCNECNKWIVIKDPVKLSTNQLDMFRQLMRTAETSTEQEPLLDNFRPPQPIYRRTVTASLKLQDGQQPSSDEDENGLHSK